MSLMLWPRRLFDIETFFDEFFTEPFEYDIDLRFPRMDIKDLNDHYEVSLEVPGYDKNDIRIELQKNILTIKSEKEETREESNEDGTYIYKERTYHNFCRSLRLPDNIKEDEIKATMQNGVLTIKIPKVEPEPKKTIEINEPKKNEE